MWLIHLLLGAPASSSHTRTLRRRSSSRVLDAGNSTLVPEGLSLSSTHLKALDYWQVCLTQQCPHTTPHVVTDTARRPAHPSQKRTEAKELHPFNNIIVKTTLAQVGLTYDPLLYPGTACQSWCGGEILIDVEASEARDRQHYPENNIADWTEKCSWDNLCSGCPECAHPPPVASRV